MAKFNVGDRVVVNDLGAREAGYRLGTKGMMTKIYPEREARDAFYVLMDGARHEAANYTRWFDLEVPLTPFEQRVQQYIRKELHNG